MTVQIAGGTLSLVLLALALVFCAGILYERHRRRASEASLSTSEALYRSVVESQTDLVCRYRPDTTLTFVNEAYCRYFSRAKHELIGTSFMSLLPEAAHGPALQYLARLLQTRQLEVMEHEVIRHDGSIGWQQWFDQPVLDGQGRIVELQAIGRDITDMKFAHVRLIQQQREVMHLGRIALLGELTGTLAHELSQPLASILSNTQACCRLLARDTPEVGPLREALHDIVQQTRHASNVIQRLRELLKKQGTLLQPLDLNALIVDTAGFIRSELEASHVVLRYVLTEDLPTVRGDPTQLRQVLLNLVMNARDAMQATEPAARELVIATHAPAEGMVECSVADAGSGITDADLPRVFEPFFTTKEHGLGLGLSICRSIIAAHAGELCALRNATRGTTFRFTLPAHAR